MGQIVHTWEPRFDSVGAQRFVLRWDDLNFNAPAIACTLPRRLLDTASELNVAFDALSVRYNGAAPGVVINRIIVSNHKESGAAYGVTVASLTTATADQTLLVPLYGLPFVWSPAWIADSDNLITLTVSGYNAADDTNICLWGRVLSTQRTPSPGEEQPARVTLDSVVWPPKTRRF